MCVIIHALRKKYLKRADVVQAMKANNSGFFMSHWNPESRRHDERRSIRTLVESEALGFFDRVPDGDVFVMHARIPSRGGVSKENVHGWEEDGISFCHNMTMSSLSGIMKNEDWNGTDSEYFFRKLFMPMHRGEHLCNPSLGTGEMGEATKRITSLMCGESNKFLFIMPDNSIVRAGNWKVLESEKREMMESRELEEVIGESVGFDGKVTKKTAKFVKSIMVERELATVVASNDSFRCCARTYEHWYGKSDSCSSRSSGSDVGSYYGANAGTLGDRKWASAYPYDDDDYDYERPTFAESGKSSSYYTVNKVSQTSCQNKKSKLVNTTEQDMDKFMAWRRSVKSGKEGLDPFLPVLTSDDASSLSIFGDLLVGTDGRLPLESVSCIFKMILRCIVYNNYRKNIEDIRSLDDSVFSSIDACYESYLLECTNAVSSIIPPDFDERLARGICDILVSMQKEMDKDIVDTNGLMKLPSECMNDALSEALVLIDDSLKNCDLSYDPYAECSEMCGNALVSEQDLMESKCQAVESMLNIVIDDNVKSNRDVEKYVKAAIVVNKRLKWIPPAILLSCDSSQYDNTGSWMKSKEQDCLLKSLNFITEACLTEMKSVDEADKKYLAKVKSLGFNFDNLGSMEIFNPSVRESGLAVTGSADAPATKSSGVSKDAESGENAEPDATPECMLGDPEKKESK